MSGVENDTVLQWQYLKCSSAKMKRSHQESRPIGCFAAEGQPSACEGVTIANIFKL